MTSPIEATGIVLAGGRSRRFGAEKMAAELDGQPLLHHAVRAVAAVCDEVLVVGSPSGLPVTLPEGLTHTPVEVLDVELHEGPLVALANAAKYATTKRLLLVAGDMPDLQPAILKRVLDWGPEDEGACLVVDGWAQPFPMGLDRSSAGSRAAELFEAGERSLRRLINGLKVDQVPETDWRPLDPDGLSFRDVDRPGDLRS